jgi:hypothetical protein
MRNVILLLGAKSTEPPLEAVPAEISHLKHLFNTHQPKLIVEYEPYLTRQNLGQLLRRFPDQVALLHFAGHSAQNQIQTNDGQVYSENIAEILETWDQKPHLVFLNGCNSHGQVSAFHDAGVNCVIAAQEPIPDGLASRFAKEFYEELLNRPEKTSLHQAFKRAKAQVLISMSHETRSLDLNGAVQEKPDWSWGIYPKNNQTDLLRQWTFNSLIQNPQEAQENNKTNSSGPLDFINETKLKHTTERWEQISEWLRRVTAQYDYETGIDRKMRMEPGIKKKETELKKIEAEILELKKNKPS